MQRRLSCQGKVAQVKSITSSFSRGGGRHATGDCGEWGGEEKGRGAKSYLPVISAE